MPLTKVGHALINSDHVTHVTRGPENTLNVFLSDGNMVYCQLTDWNANAELPVIPFTDDQNKEIRK